MKTLLVLVFVWTLVAPLGVTAQDRNAPVAACSQAERSATNQIILESDILGRLIMAGAQMQTDASSELIAAVVDLDAVHREFWREIAPTFPDCAFGVSMRSILGRFIDEMLSSASMMALATLMEAQDESALANTFQEAAYEHIERLDEMGDVVAAMMGD